MITGTYKFFVFFFKKVLDKPVEALYNKNRTNERTRPMETAKHKNKDRRNLGKEKSTRMHSDKIDTLERKGWASPSEMNARQKEYRDLRALNKSKYEKRRKKC